MAKFSGLDEFYASLPTDQRTAIERLVTEVATRFPQLQLVLAWNQPMFQLGGKYLIGFMPTKQHTNLLTVTDTPVTHFADRLGGYRHGTRSISLPFDWPFDAQLVGDIIAFRADETGQLLDGK